MIQFPADAWFLFTVLGALLVGTAFDRQGRLHERRQALIGLFFLGFGLWLRLP